MAAHVRIVGKHVLPIESVSGFIQSYGHVTFRVTGWDLPDFQRVTLCARDTLYGSRNQPCCGFSSQDLPLVEGVGSRHTFPKFQTQPTQPQTQGHQWPFVNLASMVLSSWRTRWAQRPKAALHDLPTATGEAVLCPPLRARDKQQDGQQGCEFIDWTSSQSLPFLVDPCSLSIVCHNSSTNQIQ